MFSIWLVCVIASVILINKYCRSGWWILLVALFPVAIVVLLILGRKEGVGAFKRCNECRELIHYSASTCPHCQSEQYDKQQPKNNGQISAIMCPHCRAINASDSKECYNCGKGL